LIIKHSTIQVINSLTTQPRKQAISSKTCELSAHADYKLGRCKFEKKVTFYENVFQTQSNAIHGWIQSMGNSASRALSRRCVRIWKSPWRTFAFPRPRVCKRSVLDAALFQNRR